MKNTLKYSIFLSVIFSGLFAHGYAHEGYYRILARPFVERCEARAERAGVSRPNEQILVNNCLDTYHIRVARANVAEYPEYARSSGRDPESDESHRELVQALRMYQGNVFTHPATGERFSGSAAQKQLEIELGRKLDLRKIMQNQPSLMSDED